MVVSYGEIVRRLEALERRIGTDESKSIELPSPGYYRVQSGPLQDCVLLVQPDGCVDDTWGNPFDEDVYELLDDGDGAWVKVRNVAG